MSFFRKASSSYEIPIVAEASHDAQLKMTKFLFEIHIVCTGRGVINHLALIKDCEELTNAYYKMPRPVGYLTSLKGTRVVL